MVRMRKRVYVEIELPEGYSAACATRIRMDGVERADVKAYQLSATVDGITELDLKLMVLDGLLFAGSAYVGIKDETAQLLIELGWTPPGGTDDRSSTGATQDSDSSGPGGQHSASATERSTGDADLEDAH